MLIAKLLGQFSLHVNGLPIEIQSRPAQALFAYLILNANVAHRREKLAGLIWPDTSDTNARSNLRHALWRIRKAVGADYLSTDDISVAFNATLPHQLDVAVLVQDARSDVSTAALIEGVSAYGGEFLPGFYEDWIALERERLQAAFERKIELLITRLVQDQRWHDVDDWGERWIALGHVPEPAYRALMLAHYYLGNSANIAAVYQRCADALKKELDVPPSDQTRNLYKQLSQGQVPAAPAPTRSASAATPVTGAQPAAQPDQPRHNLPQQATPFVGREAELAEIADRLVHDPDCRLLTLVGPGGIGKTRLALHAAEQHLAAFPDGAYFVSLAPIASAYLMVNATASAIGLTFVGQSDPRAQLLYYLRDKHLLLVFDNVEHVMDGVDLLTEVLVAAPRVKLLVTSRERLHVQWEWMLEVPGLEYPANEHDPQAANFSAVRLFEQLARRMNTRFTLDAERAEVVRICRLVDGTPLGLELAAAWVRVLDCAEIAQQIERNLDLLATTAADRPERHRSLRAAFEYSWQLLSPDEQKAFKKLAVFQGSFRREAAEKIAGAPLSLLFTLVDKSLLRRSAAGRFEMHPLLRQYITEKLAAGKIDAVLNTTPIDLTRLRLAQYFLEFARQHQANYRDLENEWTNLMTGFLVAHDLGMWQAVIDYGDLLSEAAFVLGHFSDVRQGSPWIADAATQLNRRAVLAHCEQVWGSACIEQGDYVEAETHLTRSLELALAQADDRLVAGVQFDLARIAIERSDYARARQLLDESQRRRERLHDLRGLAAGWFKLACLHYYDQAFDEAAELGQRALAVQQQAPDPLSTIRTLGLLSDVALYGRADAIGAEMYCHQALALCDSSQYESERVSILYALAGVHRAQGRLDAARQEVDACLAMLYRMGDRKMQAHALFRLSQLDADLGDLSAAAKHGQSSLELCRQLGDRWGLVYVAEHLGRVYAELDQPSPARAVWSEALPQATALQHPLTGALRQYLSS